MSRWAAGGAAGAVVRPGIVPGQQTSQESARVMADQAGSAACQRQAGDGTEQLGRFGLFLRGVGGKGDPHGLAVPAGHGTAVDGRVFGFAIELFNLDGVGSSENEIALRLAGLSGEQFGIKGGRENVLAADGEGAILGIIEGEDLHLVFAVGDIELISPLKGAGTGRREGEEQGGEATPSLCPLGIDRFAGGKACWPGRFVPGRRVSRSSLRLGSGWR